MRGIIAVLVLIIMLMALAVLAVGEETPGPAFAQPDAVAAVMAKRPSWAVGRLEAALEQAALDAIEAALLPAPSAQAKITSLEGLIRDAAAAGLTEEVAALEARLTARETALAKGEE